MPGIPLLRLCTSRAHHAFFGRSDATTTPAKCRVMRRKTCSGDRRGDHASAGATTQAPRNSLLWRS